MKITFYSINKETNQDPRLAFTFLLAAQGEYRGYCAAIWSSAGSKGVKQYQTFAGWWNCLLTSTRGHRRKPVHIRICGRVLLKYLPVCLPLQRTQTAARIHIVDTRDSVPGFRARVSRREPRLNFITRGIFSFFSLFLIPIYWLILFVYWGMYAGIVKTCEK